MMPECDSRQAWRGHTLAHAAHALGIHRLSSDSVSIVLEEGAEIVAHLPLDWLLLRPDARRAVHIVEVQPDLRLCGWSRRLKTQPKSPRKTRVLVSSALQQGCILTDAK